MRIVTNSYRMAAYGDTRRALADRGHVGRPSHADFGAFTVNDAQADSLGRFSTLDERPRMINLCRSQGRPPAEARADGNLAIEARSAGPQGALSVAKPADTRRFFKIKVKCNASRSHLTEFRGACEFRCSPVRTRSGEGGSVRQSNL